MSNRTISIRISCRLVHRMVVGMFSIFLLMCSILILDVPVKLVETSSADSPTVLDFTPSSYEVDTYSTMYLYLNATDPEDSEEELTPIIWWGNNISWCKLYFGEPSYIGGTPPDGWWCIPFYTTNVPDGKYNFKANVKDKDDNISLECVYVYDVYILHICDFPPWINNITPESTGVYRNLTMQITLNASDDGYFEPELTIQIQYDVPEGYMLWEQNYLSSPGYIDSNDNLNDNIGYWRLNFTPNTTAKLGNYRFRVKVNNIAGQDSGWVIKDSFITVKNNIPVARDLTSRASTVYRMNSIHIYAYVEDIETTEDMLSPHFKYRPPGEDWEDIYLRNPIYDEDNNSWRITFSPPPDNDFPIGPYDFKVWFEDEDGNESNIIEVEDLVEVKNVVPKVYSLDVTSRQGYRLEPLIITANGTDSDHSEIVLTPYFQYRGPMGDWIGYEDSRCYFLDIAQNMTGYWQIIFHPPTNADLGNYSFRVQFSDGLDTSDWMIRENTYTLMNNDPEVEIITPEQGEQLSPTVTFSAIAFDMEDDTLIYIWNFGDGKFSIEQSPIYTYEKGGYYSVSVRVYDSDRGTAMETITVRILDTPNPPDPLSNYFLIAFWIVVIIIVVIAIFIYSKIIKRIKIQGKG